MTIDTESLYRLAFDAAPVLLDAAAKGAVLLAGATVLTTAMRKASAAARQCVWMLALVSLLALPVASALLPGWQVLPDWAKLDVSTDATGDSADGVGPEPEPEPSIHAAAVEIVGAGLPTDPAPVVHAAPVQVRPAAPAESLRAVLVTIALVAWLTGAAVCLLPLLLGWLHLWWAGRRWRRIEGGPWVVLARRAAETVGLRRPVTLLQSDGDPMPMVWGVVRPRLLLPAGADEWSTDRRWVVLLHEFVHVRRHDCLAQLLARLACAVYWFNPLCWVAFKLMRREAEAACDDLVLAAGHRPSDYAQHLLEMASGLNGAALGACGPIAMARPGKLHRRLRDILDDRRDRRALTRVGAIVALALAVAAVVPMSILDAATKRPAFNKAHVSIFVDANGRPFAAGKVKEFTLDRLEDINALAAFFPGVGEDRKSRRSGAWEADIVVNFAAPAGKAVRVTVSLAESPPTWSEGRGDWPVKGDLGGFLQGLARDQTATQPATPATATPTTKAGPESETVTRVYDVRDLLFVIPRVVGGEQGGIAERPAAGAAESAEKEPTRAEILKILLELIRSTVDPESWGKRAAVRELNGQLIITQSPANHEKIVHLLAQLRPGREVLVNVEMRLLTAGLGGDRALQKMLADAPRPDGLGVDKVTGRILTAEQVQELIAASQTVAGEVRVLTAPRVTLFNGQQARVNITTKQTLSLPVAGRKGEQAEIPYYSGSQVDVAAAVSSDRRRAKLTVNLDVAELTRVDGRLEESAATAGATVEVPEAMTFLLRIPQFRSQLTGVREVTDPKTWKRSFEVIRQPVVIGSVPAPDRFLYLLVTPKVIVQREVQTGEDR